MAVGAISTAQAEVVIPNALNAVEGNGNNAFPFDIDNPFFDSIGLDIESMRYQQVYDASEFSFSSQPSLITQILFRPDGVFEQTFVSTLPDIQINLSTTAAAPDALSSVFADNIGSDETTVFNRGSLSLTSNNLGPIGGPKEFDIVIELENPFLYDPTLGNLLLDVRNFAGGRTLPFDAENTVGDATSRVFSLNVEDGVGLTDTTGLVTAFVATPVEVPSVPEPANVIGLLAAGTILAGFTLTQKTVI